MTRLRSVAAASWSFMLVFTVLHAGCGTDATGVDECRDIETARCEAGEHCGIVDDVEGCKRFYRDQCLHGLTHSRPGAPQLTACTETIRQAGQCAKEGTLGIADCAPLASKKTLHSQVCDVVLRPQDIEQCEFLASQPVQLPDAAAETAPPADATSGSD